MKSLYRIVIVTLMAVIITSCATVIATDIQQANENWSVSINTISDDANYQDGSTFYFAPGGHRYILLNVTIHNKSSQARRINLSRFILRKGKKVVARPDIVDMDVPLVSIQASKYPELEAGEKITRNLYFSFPYDIYPDSLDTNAVGRITLPKMSPS